MKSLGVAGEEFQSFGDFQRGDQVDDRPENADRVAGLLKALVGSAGFEKTGQAGRRPGTDGHGQPVTGDPGRVDPRPAGFHGHIVDQEASFEIVGAVKEHIDFTEKCFHVARAEIGDDTFDGHGRIDRAQPALRGDRLGKNVESIGLLEEGLPLQVGGLHEIAIDDSQVADAGANEKIRCRGADCAAADDDRPGGEKPLLPCRADPGEKHLARVFFLERSVHERYGPDRHCGRAC